MIGHRQPGLVARPVSASGRSAPYGRHRSPVALLQRPAPASTDPAQVCSFQLPQVCSFRLPLTPTPPFHPANAPSLSPSSGSAPERRAPRPHHAARVCRERPRVLPYFVRHSLPSSLHSSFHVRAGVAPGRVDPWGKAQSPDRPLRRLLVGGCRDRLTPGGRPPRPRQVAAPSPAKQRYAEERCELRRGPVRPDPRCPLVWLLARDKSAATPEDSRKVFGSAVVAPSSGRWQNAPMSDPDRRHLFAALVYVAAVAVGMLAAWRFAGPLLARFADAVVQMLDRWLPT